MCDHISYDTNHKQYVNCHKIGVVESGGKVFRTNRTGTNIYPPMKKQTIKRIIGVITLLNLIPLIVMLGGAFGNETLLFLYGIGWMFNIITIICLGLCWFILYLLLS